MEQDDQPDPVDQPAWNPPAHTGDTLVDFGRRLEINDWLRGGITREEVAERLRPRVERLVEGVLRRTEHRETVLRSSARFRDGSSQNRTPPSDSA